MAKLIKVTSKERITTIRITEQTKRELESFGIGGESHEEILIKVMKIARNALAESSSKITKRGNMIGTKYGRLHKTFNIETDADKYSIVCSFNDLSLMGLIRTNKQLQEQISKEWEIDLKIVNIRIGAEKYTDRKKWVTWKDPETFLKVNKSEYLLLYFVVIKQVLEEMFNIKIHEILTADDYLNLDKWEKVYKRNNLSMESFYSDIQKKLR